MSSRRNSRRCRRSVKDALVMKMEILGGGVCDVQ
jgi:hypothetical protein